MSHEIKAASNSQGPNKCKILLTRGRNGESLEGLFELCKWEPDSEVLLCILDCDDDGIEVVSFDRVEIPRIDVRGNPAKVF